jgi:UPF0288 family protein (methanogenesis marker protein 3)
MTYENTYIFKAEREAEKYKEIMPENSPKDKVLSGEIGVTNQAARRMGMVGVKTEDDDLFGPTGERFASTNIIGRILDIDKLKQFKDDLFGPTGERFASTNIIGRILDIDKLKHFKDGDVMYVTESIGEVE